MWPFKRKADTNRPLLRLTAGAEEVLSFHAGDLPIEKFAVIDLQSAAILSFVDSPKC